MATVDVENIEEAGELFMEKMGFAHDTEGVELSDDQLVNFLMICHQMEYGIGEEEEEEMHEEDEGIKVKVIKMNNGGDMSGMIDEMLGHGGPEIKGRY